MDSVKKTKQQDIFKGVEYVQIKRNNKQLMILEDGEINGMSRTALAKLIGEKIGEGVYHYTIKYFNDPKVKVGKISAVMISAGREGKGIQPDFSSITEQMKRLEERFERGNSDNNFQAIMQMKDEAFKVQIDFWKTRAETLQAENERLKKELESDGGGGNNQLVEMLLPLLTQALTKAT